MKRSLTRVSTIAATCVVGVLASLLVMSAANAAVFATAVLRGKPITACPASGCLQTGATRTGEIVTDYCRVGSADLIYDSADRRTGFVPRSSLSNFSQTTSCSLAGYSATVGTQTSQYSCTDLSCKAIRRVDISDPVRAFCQLPGGMAGGNNAWYLVYNNDGGNTAGFVPASSLSGRPNVATCF